MKTFYSISILNVINQCLYQAYITYIKKEKGLDNIYSILGSKIHKQLEKIVKNEASPQDLIKAMNEEIKYADLMGFEFMSDQIKKNWITDMTYFCEHYQKPKGNFKAEEHIIYQSPKNNLVQGYVDLQRINDDGSIDIYDYKTSAMYSKTSMLEHGRQLVVYALAKKQQRINVRSVNWIMLKYVTVTFYGLKTVKSKNKTYFTKNVEICKLGKEFADKLKNTMLFDGKDEIFVSLIIDNFIETNEIPIDYRKDFRIEPCIINYELTNEVEQECIKYIDSTIEMWENLWEYPPNTEGNSFYCNTICPHRAICEYKDTISEKDEELF